MSRLVEIAKKVGRFEIGADEFPGLKRYLTHPFIQSTQSDIIDTYNFGFRHVLNLGEIVYLIAHLVQNNQNDSNIETLLKVGVYEAAKYLGNKSFRNVVPYLANRMKDYFQHGKMST